MEKANQSTNLSVDMTQYLPGVGRPGLRQTEQPIRDSFPFGFFMAKIKTKAVNREEGIIYKLANQIWPLHKP